MPRHQIDPISRREGFQMLAITVAASFGMIALGFVLTATWAGETGLHRYATEVTTR